MRFVRRVPLLTAVSTVLVLAAACSVSDSLDPGSGSSSPDSGNPGSPDITLFAAASLTDVVAAMNEAYDGGGHLRINVGSSAQLTAQLSSGAAADVIITADVEALEAVRGEGLLEQDRIIAGNTTVLAVAPGNPAGISALTDVAGQVQMALCAPSVPCGRAAERVLAAAGLSLTGESREDSVRSVLTKVTTGQADAGFVYQTDALSAAKQGVTFLAVTDPEPNQYPAALTAEGAENEAAVRFYEWLGGGEAAGILRGAGFTPPAA